MLAECRLEVLHQGEHALLVLGGEVLGDVHLAYGLREGAVGHRHGALPAGLHLLLSGHGLAVERERCLLEIVAQVRGGRVDVVGGQVVTDLLQRGILDQVVGVGDGRRGGDDDRFVVADAHCVVVDAPVDRVVGLLEVGFRHGVVERRHVAQLDVRPRLLGQFRFDRQHAVDGLADLLLGHACQTEDRRQILLVGRADVLVLGVEVIVAVAHRQAVLRSVEDIHVAVHQVGLHADAEERIAGGGVHPGDGGRELRAVGDREQPVDGRTDRGGALGVQTHGVEAHLVEIRDLLLDAARGGLLLGHAGEEFVDALFVVVAQDVERAVARILGLERVELLPAARGVLVEVFVGGYRRVEIRQVDGRGFRGILTGCHTDGRCEKNDFFHVVRVFRSGKKGRSKRPFS